RQPRQGEHGAGPEHAEQGNPSRLDARVRCGRGPRAARRIERLTQLVEIVDQRGFGEEKWIVEDANAARGGIAVDAANPRNPANASFDDVTPAGKPARGVSDPQSPADRMSDLVAHPVSRDRECCSRGRARARTRVPSTTAASGSGRA